MKALISKSSIRVVSQSFYNASKDKRISKLWINIFPQDEAYNKAREYFLQVTYHFMILPDDLIVNQENVDAIVNYDESYDPYLAGAITTAVMLPNRY